MKKARLREVKWLIQGHGELVVSREKNLIEANQTEPALYLQIKQIPTEYL